MATKNPYFNVALKHEFWEKGPALTDIFNQAGVDLNKHKPEILSARRAYIALPPEAETALHKFDQYLHIVKFG